MTVLGIDIGTQSLRVVLVQDGEVRAECSASYTMHTPRPGWAEQDPLDWEKALATVVPRALALAGVDAREVQALAVVAQLDGCVAVDAQCQPLSPCLVWMDRRAVDYVPKASTHWQQSTGQVFDASHMAAKICWLQQERGLHRARFHQPTSYLVERLCGAYVFDHALASTTMLYNLHRRDYDDELLKEFGVSRQQIPAIGDSDKLAGVLTQAGAARCGLVAGIPVAVGTGDDFATVLGSGVVSPGPLLCGLGTAEVVGTMSATAIVDTGSLVETHGFLDGYFVQNPGWESGGALRWIREILVVDSDAELDELAAQAPPGCDGLTFLPALAGAMAPEWSASARGCFYGLSASHTRAHMARAVLEGAAFAMRDVRTRLQELGLASGDIVLQGGGAQSALWAQIRADLCQAHVHRQRSTNGSALGASLLAQALADPGISLMSLAIANTPKSTLHVPNVSLYATYDHAYARYRLLFDSLRPMF